MEEVVVSIGLWLLLVEILFMFVSYIDSDISLLVNDIFVIIFELSENWVSFEFESLSE